MTPGMLATSIAWYEQYMSDLMAGVNGFSALGNEDKAVDVRTRLDRARVTLNLLRKAAAVDQLAPPPMPALKPAPQRSLFE